MNFPTNTASMTAYENEIIQFRKKSEDELTASPINWLSLAGLFWFTPGYNSFGSGANNDFRLPSGPEHAGQFFFDSGSVTLHPEAGVTITSNGQPLEVRSLNHDHTDKPDLLEFGTIAMMVIQRGTEILLRVWDKDAPAYKNFTSLNYFPIKPEYRITAKYVAYDPPKPIQAFDVIGTVSDGQLLGQAQFTYNNVECHLEAEKSGERLRFNFTDGTSGKATYGGGRVLVIAKPENGQIILDFNLAENWPCAYTGYATCPVPPRENRLPISIEAGEMNFH